MGSGKKILETERLLLREFDPEDGEFIFELLNSPTWIKYIGDKNVKTLDDARKYIENVLLKSYRESGFGFWLVELKFIRFPIGLCGLIKRNSLDDVDIGFAFLPEFAGNGYGYESSYATLEFAKEKLGLERIVAITVKENFASIGLLKKLGLKYEKTVKAPNKTDEELMLFGTEFVD